MKNSGLIPWYHSREFTVNKFQYSQIIFKSLGFKRRKNVYQRSHMNFSESLDLNDLALINNTTSFKSINKRADLVDLLINMNNRKKRELNIITFDNMTATFDGKEFREIDTDRVLSREESERAKKFMTDALENSKKQIKQALEQVKNIASIFNLSKLWIFY